MNRDTIANMLDSIESDQKKKKPANPRPVRFSAELGGGLRVESIQADAL